MSGPTRPVSLVLGSGGARGLAHIGVIDHLDASGYDIRCIAGSSMGALIGGIYAAGELDVYTRWVSALTRNDVVRLLDLSFGRGALFKGDRIIAVLRELIGERDIERLPIAFTAVATDLDRQKEVWLNRGPLFDAIRASIAYPTLFAPHEVGGRRLFDGGLVNPVPIAPTLTDPTDLTIAVNLNAPGRLDVGATPVGGGQDDAPSGEIRSGLARFIDGLQHMVGAREPGDVGFADVATRSIDTMQSAIARYKLAAYSPDVVVDIPREACSFFEFHRARELIDVGRRRAAAVLPPVGAG